MTMPVDVFRADPAAAFKAARREPVIVVRADGTTVVVICTPRRVLR